MRSHIRTFLTGLFALITAFLLTLAPAAGLTDTAVRSAKEGGIRTAVYGGSLKDNIAGAATQIAVNDATAFVHGKIGDVKEIGNWGEGSFPGAVLKGAAGCISSDLNGGNCGRGAVLAAGAEFATGILHSQTGGNTEATAEAMLRYGNPVLAALTSGGDVGQFGINQGIADSQLKNNYLSHSDKLSLERSKEKLAECEAGGKCSEAELSKLQNSINFFEDLDRSTDAALVAACEANQTSPTCRQEIINALMTLEVITNPTGFPAGASELLPNGYRMWEDRYTTPGFGEGYPAEANARNLRVLLEYHDTKVLLAQYPQGYEMALHDFAVDSAAQGGIAVIGGLSFPRFLGGKVQTRPARNTENVNSTQLGVATKGGIDDIIAGGQRLPSTGGRTTQIQKTGGLDRANADFNSLGLNNVRDIKMPNGGSGRVGELSDGTKVIVRSGSSENRPGFSSQPTLEIQYPNGSTKIRY